MAPSKKKKKPAGNPTRAVATVSLPSKAKLEAETKQDEGTENPEHQDAIDPPGKNPRVSETGKNESVTISEMTPEDLERHLEHAELQELVEAKSAQSRKEAARQATRLETERRTLRLQANKLSTSLWLSEDVIKELLQSAKEDHRQISFRAFKPDVFTAETDLTIKVWTLRRLLESLGLPRTDESLKHVLRLALADAISNDKDYIWGVPDLLEWYGHNADNLGMALYDTVNAPLTAASESPDVSRPVTPEPEELQNTSVEPEGSEIEASNDSTSANQSSESDEDNDPSKLLSKWLALRRSMLAVEHLSDGNQTTSRFKARMLRWQQRLKKVESDPLFDVYEAEVAWREILPHMYAKAQVEKAQYRSTQKGQKAESAMSSKSATGKRLELTPIDEIKMSGPGNVQDQQELDVIFGDMFTVPKTYRPDPALSAEENPSPDIQLVDFGKWSGLHPRRVLEETCKIRDKKSRVQLSLITKRTYSNRHKLTIHWTVPQTYDPWLSSLPKTLWTKFSPLMAEIQMQQIAAPTAAQSEAYISTVALFALCLTAPGQQKMSLRMPPVWRDVWQELSESRRIAIESAEKEEIKCIKQIIEDVKKESVSKQEESGLSVILKEQHKTAARPQHNTLHMAKLDADTVREQWAKKASTSRSQHMQEQRAQLPISNYRKQIVECVAMNSITIISAETGAGKSTQVPSFLLENSLASGRDCRILVTQPRRISAITLARRVSQELGESPNELGTRRSLVGYSIRLESKVSASTRLTFATTGVLLRMIETSPDVEDLDYLMLDEVHERTMDMDLLFIAVRHLVSRRPGLKVVLMSATVDSKKFSQYFDDAPVLEIPGRTFPVQVGYLEDAMAAVGKSEDDSSLPEEVTEDDILDQATKVSANGLTSTTQDDVNDYRIDYTLIVNLIVAIATKPHYVDYSKAILVFMPGIGEIRRLNSALLSRRMFQQGWIVHMLHSSFSTEDLERAFMMPPHGMRKLVISTNIAETGVTIPDVTAVIDTCKEKIMRFDDRRQMSKLTEGFISRASSRQRRGRAARVQPGLCFHLVSKKRYDTLMLEQSIPEMLRLSLQDAILRIKIWNLGAIEQTLQQAIDPPTPKNIRRAVEALRDAGALTGDEALTPLGRQVARLPLDVNLSKLAILGIVLRRLDAAISIVAILSSKSPFLVSPHQNDRSAAASAKAIFAHGDSDLLTIYAAYLAWQKACARDSAQNFCHKHSLSAQVLSQIEDQKIQLLVYVVDAGILGFADDENLALRLARSGNNYNRKSFFVIPERFNGAGTSEALLSSVIAAAFYPKLLTRQGNGWRNVSSNQMTSIAPNSINNTKLNHRPPKWLSFYESMQTQSGHTNAIETSSVPEAAIVLLLGEASFNIYAGVISIDNGRIRFSVQEWKTMIALKILRGKIKSILYNFYRDAGKASYLETDGRWLRLWFTITQALDRQNEMSKARILTSAHHVPMQVAVMASSNNKSGPSTRGNTQRLKERGKVEKQTRIQPQGIKVPENAAPGVRSVSQPS